MGVGRVRVGRVGGRQSGRGVGGVCKGHVELVQVSIECEVDIEWGRVELV